MAKARTTKRNTTSRQRDLSPSKGSSAKVRGGTSIQYVQAVQSYSASETATTPTTPPKK
ncbi:MAG TPA: hypothetical protein VMS64_00175 [Candidatus Methylomirabilis sp.]|nr:hypothetical protein [Candidatus Methylomirabilis sp.]